ncbi:matrixin family metalloprotease [Methanolapillus ohkumae]|uniref:Peptidase M10 metallopeptidase domain-containing protein n=1 Tax=Methanolapillus ohkumae TaxID=3028298 RepID=A0AA96V8F3_9EURY|nr:hypothetical protein MsAm2_15690 [Methanosarcinaceae archaeon Am2]
MMMKPIFMCFAVLLTITTISQAAAYQAMDWKWEDPNVTLTYVTEGEGALPTNWVDALDAAQKTWNNADSSLQFSSGSNGNNVYYTQMPAGYAGKIGLVWISMPPNPSNSNITSPEYNSSDVPLRFKYVEIIFNSNITNWTTNGSRRGPDVQGVATHELGHVLGLDHNIQVDASKTIMIPSGSNTTALRALKEDDLIGLHALYPNLNRSAGMTTIAGTYSEDITKNITESPHPDVKNNTNQTDPLNENHSIIDHVILYIKTIIEGFL